MPHDRLRPSVYVHRMVAPNSFVQPDKLRAFADSHNIHGIRFARAQNMAITIMGSGEILGLYDYCHGQLPPDDASELGDILYDALPSTADAYVEVPMTLHWRLAPSRTRPHEACLVMAPSETAKAERTAAQEIVTDFVASRLGCIGVLAETFDWRERLPGVRIASGHRAGALTTFYEALQGETDALLPKTILYEPVSVDDVQ